MSTAEKVALDNLREALREDESGLNLVRQLKAKQTQQADELKRLQAENTASSRHCDIMAQMICRMGEYLTAHGHSVREALGTPSTAEEAWLKKVGLTK